MSNPIHVPEPEGSYFVDAENVAEMARLTKQARTLSEHLGLFPERLDLSQYHRILDIGCGPGEWALEVARSFPAKQIIGIDSSNLMINYVRYITESQGVLNAQFQLMDARQPLVFPDASFDLVSARFISGFLTTNMWPQILRECFRILRPGGILCSCEPENLGSTTSPSLTRYNHLVVQTLRLAGQCFSPAGDQAGTAAIMPRLFREAGFQQPQQGGYIINFSAGMPAYLATYDNLKTLMKLLQPLIVQNKLITQPEIDVLYARTLEEMEDESFCAAAFFQRVWGKKPE